MNLDDQLRSAASDVRSQFASTAPPPFEPPTPVGSRLALLALVAFVVGGGWWLVRPNSETVPTIDMTTEITIEQPTIEEDPTAPTPSADASTGIIGLAPLSTSPMDEPGLDAFVAEPDTGVALRQLVDAAPGAVVQPVFSRTQSYNADGTLVLLYRTRDPLISAGHLIVDAETGEIIAEPDLSAASDIENVSWDSTNPKRLFFTRGADVMSYDVTTGVTQVAVATDCESLDLGDTAGSTSSGSPLLGLLCQRPGQSAVWAAANLQTGALQTGAEATNGAAPFPTVSGTSFIAVDDSDVIVLDESLAVVRSIAIEASSFTVAQDADGSDVLVATVYGGPTAPGSVVVIDLATGSTRVVVGPETGAPYPPRGTQLSTAATDRPSVVALSTFSDETGPLANEIMLLELNGVDSELRRLAHHRMVDNRDDGWPSAPMIAISPDGSRVLFSSNWGTDTIATYEIALSP